MFPAVLLLLALSLQAAVWFHTRGVALAAAREGARLAATSPGGDAWEERARLVVGDAADVSEVTRTWTDEVIEVVVEVPVPSLVPGVDLEARGRARAEAERFRAAG